MAEGVGLVHESQLVDQVNSEHQNDWLVQDSVSMSEAHENFHLVLGVGTLYSLTDFLFEDVETTVAFTGMLSWDQIDSCICALPDNAVAEPIARTAEISDSLQSTTLAIPLSLLGLLLQQIKTPTQAKEKCVESKRKYCKNKWTSIHIIYWS